MLLDYSKSVYISYVFKNICCFRYGGGNRYGLDDTQSLYSFTARSTAPSNYGKYWRYLEIIERLTKSEYLHLL